MIGQHIRVDAARGRGSMPTYVILYTFTPEGAKNIRESVKRAGRVRQQNARVGFTVKDVYWTQGSYDMVAIVEAPSEEAMMGAMMNVVSAGNVTSVTMRAFDALEMSRVLAKTLPLPDDDAPKAKAPAKAKKR
jgi:uncharacterized protein with GYD domain